MSSKPSEQMMDLLQELALLKELDKDDEKGLGFDLQAAEVDSRKRRRQGIGDRSKLSVNPRHNRREARREPRIELWLPPRDSNPDSLLQRQVS